MHLVGLGTWVRGLCPARFGRLGLTGRAAVPGPVLLGVARQWERRHTSWPEDSDELVKGQGIGPGPAGRVSPCCTCKMSVQIAYEQHLQLVFSCAPRFAVICRSLPLPVVYSVRAVVAFDLGDYSLIFSIIHLISQIFSAISLKTSVLFSSRLALDFFYLPGLRL